MAVCLRRATHQPLSGSGRLKIVTELSVDVTALRLQGRAAGRILESGSRFDPPDLAVEVVDHIDLASDKRRDQRHRCDARRGGWEAKAKAAADNDDQVN